MPKTVEIPNIGNVEFPDEMSPDQIVDAIKTRIIPQHQQKTQTVSATPQFQDLSAGQDPKFAERDQGYTPINPRAQPNQTLKQLGAEVWEEANRSLIPEGVVATTLATTAGIASPTLMRLATEKAPKATAGVFEAADDLVRGAATPLSIGMLGIAGLPAAAQRTALIGISAWMAKNAGTDAGEAVEAFRQGDSEGGTRKIVNALAAAGLSALSFAGGVRPKPIEKPPVLKPSEELISDASKKAPQLQASIQEAGKEPNAGKVEERVAMAGGEPPRPIAQVAAGSAENVLETPGTSPQEAQGQGLVPAIQTPEGRVVTGEDHVSAYEKAKATGTPDTSGSKEGFQTPTGEFISREQAAQETGLPTQTEPGKLHSSDLPPESLHDRMVYEIKAQGLTTRQKIRSKFPKLSEEDAEALRKEAFPSGKTVDLPKTTPLEDLQKEGVRPVIAQALVAGEITPEIAVDLNLKSMGLKEGKPSPGVSHQQAVQMALEQGVAAVQEVLKKHGVEEAKIDADKLTVNTAKLQGQLESAGAGKAGEPAKAPAEPPVTEGINLVGPKGKLSDADVIEHYGDFFREHPIGSTVKFAWPEGGTDQGTVTGHTRGGRIQIEVKGEENPVFIGERSIVRTESTKPEPPVEQKPPAGETPASQSISDAQQRIDTANKNLEALDRRLQRTKKQSTREEIARTKGQWTFLKQQAERDLSEATSPRPPEAPSPPAKPVSVGPGAASVGEAGTYTPIQRMADELRATTKPSEPIDTQLSVMEKAKSAMSKAGDVVQRSIANLQAVKDAVWEKYTGLPEYGDEQRAVGKWFRALQQSDHEARNFAKQIVKAVPSKIRREAMTNWIQADGDEAILRQRAAASKGPLKLGYEQALKLTDREKQIAQMFSEYFDQQLQRGIDAGILQSGLENYITQVWKKENPITKKLVSDLAYGKLTPNFKYARKRMFDSYFEGEQAGYQPNKDAGFLVTNYDQSFNRSLAARAFIKDLHEGKASDGRPLVELSGNGKVIGEDEGKSAVLITPHSKPDALGDYRTIDHPALRGWKYATTTPEGNTVLVKGDMLVHPEAYQKLKNRLSVSAFRQNPISRAILQGQTTIKQTMLSVSGFHQVQETLHALGHRVNPLDLPEIDFSEPVTKALAEHGLQLADYNALESFSEGLSGGGLMQKIPVIGKKLHAYNDWLFQDYIPRLKNQMAKLSLERNRERYPNLSEDKLVELSASEANAAFGELPYRYMGRSPTLQDALRAFILAPDFLEARTRFAGRALMPYGREQLVALGLLAGTQYITARIVNQILDNDPHWEMKNAFRIVAGNHAYGLRSIPGDMIHLVSDPRSFFYYRMSPALKTAVEYVTGRDARGVKRDIMEQVKDLAEMPIPISMKSKIGQQWWESFLNSFGVQEQRYDAIQNINQRVAEFKKSNNITSAYESTYDPEKDKFAALRMAVENGQESVARKEFEKLKKTTSTDAIFKHFKLSYNRPFTGSSANERKFLESLDETGKREYDEAKDLRQARLQMILSLGRP